MWDYESLRIVWWLVLVVLAAGFAVTAGFDLGAGMLLHYAGRTDIERRVILNVVGPTWEGNQVWLIVLGGASFAAWPLVYAAAFSGLYLALMLLLVGLALRPLGFDFRSKMAAIHWRKTWDLALFLGAFIPALILNVGLGNLFLGLPFFYDAELRLTFTAGFWSLLHPFALLVAVSGIALCIMHGGVYLQWRSEGAVSARAARAVKLSSAVFVIGFVLAGIWIAQGLDGYAITSVVATGAPTSPLNKTVMHAPGLWLQNYRTVPLLWVLPLLTLSGTALAATRSSASNCRWAFAGSTAAMLGAVATSAAALFPFIMPSITRPDHGLTIWDASASLHTLRLLTVVTVVFLPIVLTYTVWAYRVIWGQITTAQIDADPHTLY